MKRLPGETYCLIILNALMNSNRALSTKELCDLAGCERKTVYSSISSLEINGFNIEISKTSKNQNTYKFIKLYTMY